MELKFTKVKVDGYNNPQKCLTKKVFKYYFEKMGYTRKRFISELGLNHRIFTIGIKAYYTPEKVEKLRVKKIVQYNITNRVKTWSDRLDDIEVFIPGFKKDFENYVKDDPGKLLNKLILINDDFYRFKKALPPIKKYLNQSRKRLGKHSINLVSNGLEFKVKEILDEFNIEYICQYPIKKYLYDFKVGNTLIEVDGRYHIKGNRRDRIKDRKAKQKGFKILRITEKEIRSEPLRIKKCLKNLK